MANRPGTHIRGINSGLNKPLKDVTTHYRFEPNQFVNTDGNLPVDHQELLNEYNFDMMYPLMTKCGSSISHEKIMQADPRSSRDMNAMPPQHQINMVRSQTTNLVGSQGDYSTNPEQSKFRGNLVGQQNDHKINVQDSD